VLIAIKSSIIEITVFRRSLMTMKGSRAFGFNDFVSSSCPGRTSSGSTLNQKTGGFFKVVTLQSFLSIFVLETHDPGSVAKTMAAHLQRAFCVSGRMWPISYSDWNSDSDLLSMETARMAWSAWAMLKSLDTKSSSVLNWWSALDKNRVAAVDGEVEQADNMLVPRAKSHGNIQVNVQLRM
jgi:hypothetical protein